MSRARSIALSAAAGVAALLGGFAKADSDEAVPTYTAHYEVEFKGLNGESTQSLEHTGDGYRFESVTEARGIARLLRRRPIIEESRFELHDDMPRPLDFRVEDGTRKGEDDVEIDFDWPDGTAHVTTADGSIDLPLTPGVHDRVTLQLALMRELENGVAPGPHALIDDDSIKTYRYEVEGEETLATPAGSYETIKVVQRREGSSRHTIIWAAPALRYLPVKIEQRRDDETLTTLLLESVQGL